MAAWLLNLDGVSGDTAATPDEIALPDLALDPPTADFVSDPAAPDELPVGVALDQPGVDWTSTVTPDTVSADITLDPPTAQAADTTALPDELAVPVAMDPPTAGELDATTPADDITLTVAVGDPGVTFAATATPDPLAAPVVHDAPTAAFGALIGPDSVAADVVLDDPTVGASGAPDELPLPLALDPPSTAMAYKVFPDELAVPVALGAPTAQWTKTVGPDNGPGVPLTIGDPPSTSFGMFVRTAEDFLIPITLTIPTFSFKPSNTQATPDTLIVPVVLDEPSRTITPPSVTPIVAPRLTPPALPVHIMGIGPWSSAVVWRGASNYGVASGLRASEPAIQLPTADAMTVTLRLDEASEASTSHTFLRGDAIVIQENITDLWWRRRDPRRGVTERLGRFNATTVDTTVNSDGTVGVQAAYTDYQGVLADRIVSQYLTPTADPPTTQWATGTLIIDILRWAIPTNMGLDLADLAVGAPFAGKIKNAFHLPLGQSMSDLFKNLQAVTDTPFEWWVDTPGDDAARPKLRIGTRGTDRGITLFDIGGNGPIESWSMQRQGDRYANYLLFMGADGGVVKSYADQIALYGQRDAYLEDSSVSDAKLASGTPDTKVLNAAADKKLAELAANLPSYQLTLRQGFWEGRGHIDVGDWVGLRLELGTDAIREKYRVSELAISVDGTGTETVTLTLGTPRPSRDPRSRTTSIAKIVRYVRTYSALDGSVNP